MDENEYLHIARDVYLACKIHLLHPEDIRSHLYQFLLNLLHYGKPLNIGDVSDGHWRHASAAATNFGKLYF